MGLVNLQNSSKTQMSTIEMRNFKKKIEAGISKLPADEKRLVRALYFGDLESRLPDADLHYGLPTKTIEDLHCSALRRLRVP